MEDGQLSHILHEGPFDSAITALEKVPHSPCYEKDVRDVFYFAWEYLRAVRISHDSPTNPVLKEYGPLFDGERRNVRNPLGSVF